MADYRVPQPFQLINQQIDSHENLNTQLLKAETLIEFAMNDGFLNNEPVSIYYYLWVISDVIEKTKKINEEYLNLLLKMAASKKE